MQKINTFFKNINPFKEIANNSKIEFILQKFIAFLVLYLISSILMEVIIIGLFVIFGYDALHGQFPTGEWVQVLPLYGMIGFSVLTLLYVRLIEKRKNSDIGLKLNWGFILNLLKGILLGIALIVIVLIILIIMGRYSFDGIEKKSFSSLLIWFFAFFIQASTEELMCRGFLQTSLSRRVSRRLTILISSIAFILPHLTTILEMDLYTVIISIINLFLISVLFSLALIHENSIGIAFGIHFGWNFCLGTILGLTVSGSNTTNGIIQFVVKPGYEWLTGGEYGIEASIILIPILILVNILFLRTMKGNKQHAF